VLQRRSGPPARGRPGESVLKFRPVNTQALYDKQEITVLVAVVGVASSVEAIFSAERPVQRTCTMWSANELAAGRER
jgi:hypothetical protein